MTVIALIHDNVCFTLSAVLHFFVFRYMLAEVGIYSYTSS